MAFQVLIEGGRHDAFVLPSLHHLRGHRMKSLLIRLWKEEEGQDLTEYALLLVLLSLVATVAVKALGGTVNTIFTNANTNLT